MSVLLRKALPWLCLVISFATGFGAGYYSGHKPGKPPAADGFWPRLAEASARRRTALDEAARLIQIESWTFDRARHMPAVVGTVVNGSDRTLNVTVTFNLYDRSGVQVGSADGFVRNLEPANTGRFEAVPAPDESAVTARLHKIDVN